MVVYFCGIYYFLHILLIGTFRNDRDILMIGTLEAMVSIYKAYFPADTVIWQSRCKFHITFFGLKGSGGCMSERNLEEFLQETGYDSSKTLVLYDNRENLLSSRAWWIFSHYGIPPEKIKVLDGGWKHWVANGNPVVTECEEIESAKMDITENKIARIQLCAGNKLIGLGEVQTLLSERDGIFIDTRTEEEFSGQFLFGNARGGHIPGALHFEWINGIDEENNDTFKSEDQMREEFPELWENQPDLDTPIVSYCQVGIRAANVAFMLEGVCGFKNVKVYEKSMQEYLNREGMHVE
uniref:Rhodaneselike domaincontaining protein putative n=1 Tax=Albugo laibachii Nc14 TaxID=890382 RepID=F0WJB0_9STRA|nr:rhodaneselike domaincontaining protein putative [Albugo laibachii Nc14]|eukprot:CCA21357.1 rhodaneselike domaincontaining protein putative [Albugo laibachii Nc14]